jgi:hypothetical protein
VIARPQLLFSVLLFSQGICRIASERLAPRTRSRICISFGPNLAFRSDDFFDGPQIGKERLVSWHGSVRLIQPGDCNGVET